MKKTIHIAGFLYVVVTILPGCLAHARDDLVDEANAWRRTRVFFVTETASGHQPIQSNPRVFVTVPEEPTVLDKAIRPVLENVIRDQGGRLTDKISNSDVVVGVHIKRRLREKDYSTFKPVKEYKPLYWILIDPEARMFGLDKYTTFVEIAKRTVTDMMYQITIEFLVSSQNQKGKPAYEQVWRAFMDLDGEDFERDPKYYLTMLFNQYGNDPEKKTAYW
jgi:hypothetical protein